MPSRRILFSWIGHTDLRAMAASLPDARQAEVLQRLPPGPRDDGLGPIKTLLDHERFDEVHLLSNHEPALNRWFAKWLGGDPVIHPVSITNPTDYTSIFTAVDGELAAQPDRRGAAWCILLSPGTPAMTAVWVLLGKSRYPATFYQTHKGKAWVTDIPFDLALQYVPELLREPDAHFQHLAASSPQEVAGFEAVAGDSPAIRLAVGRARRAALRDVPVLILGESGTGKELFARAIHAAGHRSSRQFLAINCGAVSRELQESELFGHKKNAFTGAAEDRAGAFEAADGGTLFLDEVGDCDPALQVKLLRVLQPPPGRHPCHREFTRVGESKLRTSNVRVIAATNRDLLAAVRNHAFREDLYYRLAVLTIKLPPLRDRGGDVVKVARSLLTQLNEHFRTQEPGYQDKALAPSALELIRRHPWPGNVRELSNVLTEAAVMAAGDTLGRADLADAIAEVPGRATADAWEQPLGDGFVLDDWLEEIRKHYLRRALDQSGGMVTRAAKLLGIKNYQTLAAQLKRLGIEPKK